VFFLIVGFIGNVGGIPIFRKEINGRNKGVLPSMKQLTGRAFDGVLFLYKGFKIEPHISIYYKYA